MEWKVPYYNILNMLLVGVCFVLGTILIRSDIYNDILFTVMGIALSYCNNVFVAAVIILTFCFEIGLIINRIGSVVLEDNLRKIGLLEKDRNEKAFNDKKKQLAILDILSREYASSRSQMTLFILLLLIATFNKAWIIATFCGAFISIFYMSLKKYDQRISRYSKIE